MARLPSAPAPNTLIIAGHIITARDIMLVSADAVEAEGRAIGLALPLPSGVSLDEFQRRAEEAANIIHHAITTAAGQAMAAQARVTPLQQAALARDVAAKAEALIRAIGVGPAAQPGDIPTTLALMLEHSAAAEPSHRSYAIERMMDGSAWWGQVVDVRTERDMPPGEPSTTSMTSEEADAFLARLAPPTPAQEQRGRAEAAVFAAMKTLPDALGILVALAGAAEQAAARDARKRSGRRTDPFAELVICGIVRAYNSMFGAWPEGKAYAKLQDRTDARKWTYAVLDAAHRNLTSGAVRGDSAIVAERVGELCRYTSATLGDYLNDAVAAESEAQRG